MSSTLPSALTLAAAQSVLAAAVACAEETAVPSSMTVLDASGRLVAAVRMDGAPLISVDTSAAKARTSVFFGGAASGDLAGAVQPGAPLYTVGAATGETLAFLAGAVPLRAADGTLLGAIGSGGGAPEQDAVIAQAGADALR